MRRLERVGLAVLGRLDPEAAHGLALRALRAGFGAQEMPAYPRLATRLGPLPLANPLGIAAGFDKNAEAVAGIMAAGPGFLEVGAVTPRPQPGNPVPRLFRLREDAAVINRFGFNNDGMAAMVMRLDALREAPGGLPVPLGINLGANKDSADRAGDYETLIAGLGQFANFLTINVSSPNTERLRDLQGRAALDALLERCGTALAGLTGLKRPVPLFLKIAPDLDEGALDDVAALALDHGLAGIIATNTTLTREGLQSRWASQAGGLSGRPLFARSTAVLAGLRRRVGDRLTLVGVGGIEDADTAYAKIRAGAAALQLYSALAYRGLGLLPEIAAGLDQRLAADGFARLEDAIGVDVD